jgi:hypothetical protein
MICRLRSSWFDRGGMDFGQQVTVLAHDCDRFPDLGVLGFSWRVQILFDASDQAADPVDLLLRGHGLGFRPLISGGHRGDPLAIAQQVGEVCPQVRQIGDIAAEVLFRVKSGRVASIPRVIRSG